MPLSKSPLLRINQNLLFLVMLTVVLYYGRPILVPFVFAVMLAMLMAPLCRWLDSKGTSRIISCLICVFILLLIFLGMIAILMAQLSGFIQDLPLFEQKTNEMLISIQQFIERQFNIPVSQQSEMIRSETRNVSQSIGKYFTSILRSSAQLIVNLVITLVFTYLMLFHKEKYYTFFLKFTAGHNVEEKETVLNSISLVAQQYLKGRAISIMIMFVLYLISLWVLGIKGALLLASVAALVNILPYIGPVLAAVIPFTVALVTEVHWQPAIWLLLCFFAIQALDNYFLTPYFLGGEVSLSALSTFIAIICGGFIWGVAGMILFIPMLSIAKIIFDYVPQWHAYGFLIGDPGGRPTDKLLKWISKFREKLRR
jgi:predicted PurR-regulated permease PerM